ncbi:MAG: hypothetical protein JNM28_05610 [Armatimonadetes bacterium]|nr:hypothetical protein [Armatimonadota bacterium]MBS1712294.1 hypothetical protein [Armatimonadota bacterium]MBX3108001.1 hypothetical protein [Fimbriimonadaceae bacterium]
MLRLAPYAAQLKREIFDALRAGSPPPLGEFDEDVWRAAHAKAEPQMGTTVFAPDRMVFEFIYQSPDGTTVLPVAIQAPERIVYLPVPEWVVENVWQGEVLGCFAFESEADAHVEQLRRQLSPEGNRPLFDRPGPKRKE